MSNSILLTILTPVYNRKTYLKKLYESLKKQEDFRFQWLVIDDGSTDNTEVFFNTLPKNRFQIDYYKKENGGKHSALNFSHKYIRGKYLAIVDSDDYLTNDATAKIIKYWTKYNNQSIGGITFQRGREDKSLFDKNMEDGIMTIPEAMKKNFKGDHFETVRSDLFKKFIFPIFGNEKFIAEGAMWYLVTRGRKIVYVNEVLYIAEYLDGGLTKTGRKLHINNPLGAMWHASVFLSSNFNLKIRTKNAILYNVYAMFSNINLVERLKKNIDSKMLVLLTSPLGWGIYHYWRVRCR